ncbi:MAG: DNA-3-methyladenine glycosylase [Chitinophagaceae bacterium]|nr:DNA-3-methyladenine glycosylase [Chitinophagaceae bacterium]
MKKLPFSFYRHDDILGIARALMGKLLVTVNGQSVCSGRIVELEAYAGETDKASHAWNGRRTQRNEVMYGAGGSAYVYLCYGIHHLFNVVTGSADQPHAVLIRALEPVKGIAIMEKRMKRKADHTITRGPGNLSKAMGIDLCQNGISLRSETLYVADDGFVFPDQLISLSPRIGVDYAGEDAKRLYRFYIKGNPFVSGKPR